MTSLPNQESGLVYVQITVKPLIYHSQEKGNTKHTKTVDKSKH